LSYGAGLLALGLMDAYVFIIPLWAVLIGANATEVGLLVGVRSLLPGLLAIHGGVLIDRYGPRRIMIVFITVIIVMAPLYTLLPWFVPLLVMQTVIGLALTMQWVGAQTTIAHLSKGDTTYLGRFSFASRVGTFIAPVVFGLLWDLTSPAVCFIGVSVWAAAMLALTLAISDGTPEAAAGGTRRPAPTAVRPAGGLIRALMPKLSDYRDTLALCAIPAIAISIAACFLRNSTSSIQGSIYVVYLTEIGLAGTVIGILFAAVEGASGLGSLVAGRASRHFSPFAMLTGSTAAAIALIAVTPLLGGIVAFLLLAQVARGLIQGIHQPVVFSIQAKAVPRERQGATVALRVTVNRISAITVPVVMGILADTFGISASFFVLGGVLLAGTGVLWLFARRIPEAAVP
jgi:MFS family permease